MPRPPLQYCLFLAASLLGWPIASTAQEVVHATLGTVTSIDSAAKTITVLLPGAKEQLFKVTGPTVPIDFDKRMSADSQPAATFQTTGAFAVVFYIGGEDNQTAVALKDLGKGPFSSTDGKVTIWDRHLREMTLTDSAGAIRQFRIAPETIVETVMGALDGSQYQPRRGDEVRVVSQEENGASTALFVKDM